jgi:hypothetical protein
MADEAARLCGRPAIRRPARAAHYAPRCRRRGIPFPRIKIRRSHVSDPRLPRTVQMERLLSHRINRISASSTDGNACV